MPTVTKGLNVRKRYKGFVPFCFRLNENTIDKTKQLEVGGHNFINSHYNCEVLLCSLNNEVTSTSLQSTTQVSGNRECDGVLKSIAKGKSFTL